MLRLPPLELSSPRPDASSRNGRRRELLGLIRKPMKPMKPNRMGLRRLHMTMFRIRLKRELAMVRP